MAKYLAAALLCASLSACSDYAYQGFSMDGLNVNMGETVRSAALGGLVGGAVNYAVGANPLVGVAAGAVTGAAIDYLSGPN